MLLLPIGESSPSRPSQKWLCWNQMRQGKSFFLFSVSQCLFLDYTMSISVSPALRKSPRVLYSEKSFSTEYNQVHQEFEIRQSQLQHLVIINLDQGNCPFSVNKHPGLSFNRVIQAVVVNKWSFPHNFAIKKCRCLNLRHLEMIKQDCEYKMINVILSLYS